ncbi:glycosyltransferase 87 family protein [Nocardioides sp. 616]|uniref:glycosyltransferase 87 family protein n=1 Tax=Nocardioides sp. 616 TaxID=2268090 RepID=UPI0013B38BF5|nr:glycosyltransferase 87 family protein [Nocardioides sp. 616]
MTAPEARISLRRRLPGDVLLVLGTCLALVGVQWAWRYGLGWDAHAYYVAWDGGLYDATPGVQDAYNYSPAFAQAVWPLVQLPWPVFCGVMVGSAALGVGWLLRGTRPLVALGLWLVCVPEILSGNIYWLLAVCAVLGASRGTPWVFVAFTKILPCLGPVWFLARGEWRRAASFIAASVLVLGTSLLADPSLWRDWLGFLTDNAGGADAASGSIVPPLWLRLPCAVLLTGYAARRDRRWLLPVVMLLATPVLAQGSFALLAAIPRLRAPVVAAGVSGAAGPADRESLGRFQ